MPLASSQRYLLIDTASPIVQTGIIENKAWQAFHRSEKPALSSLFQGIQSCLGRAQTHLAGLNGFIYCHGPGSTLGLRIAAMAIEGWKALSELRGIPLYTYSSLTAGAVLLMQRGILPPFAVLAHYRPGQWHCLTISADGTGSPFVQLTSQEVEQKTIPCYGLQFSKHAAPFPSKVDHFDYDLSQLPAVLESALNPEPQDQAQPFALTSREYTRWQRKRHS